MADNDKLPTAIQESIVTALAFITDDNTAQIALLVEIDCFDPPLDDIVQRCLGHRKEFKRAPGREHLDDVFSDILDDKSHKLNQQYHRLLHGFSDQANNLDTTYVLSRTADFIQIRKLRNGLALAVERYQKGGASVADDLRTIFRDCLKIQTSTREYGFTLNEDAALNFLDRDDNDHCNLGIPELNKVGCIPTKQELLVFVAARNRGKSQFAHYCGKYALLQGWTTFHYTLENSPEMSAQRYYQTLFSGVRRARSPAESGKYEYTEFTDDKNGNPKPREDKQVLTPNFVIERHDDTLTYLRRRADEDRRLRNLRIRRFPTGQLTFGRLEQDLDEIELVHKQKPDMLIIDSPQLMRYDRKNEYAALGELYIQLRGLAVERNISVICTHQGNRKAESAPTVYGDMTAGSIDVIGVADNVITYSQTQSEEQHGLARLFTQKVRNDTARQTVCVTQHYASGQFCMDSRPMTKHLQKAVNDFIGSRRRDEEDIDDDDEFEDEVKPVRLERTK